MGDAESLITRGVREILTLCKIANWKHWAGPMSMNGVADIIGTMQGGRALYFEVKAEGKLLRPEQETFLQIHREQGALCSVVHSPGEALSILKGINYDPAMRLWL